MQPLSIADCGFRNKELGDCGIEKLKNLGIWAIGCLIPIYHLLLTPDT